jgi:antitoxin ParD1/3/4
MVKITLSIPKDIQAFVEYQTIKNRFRSIDDYLCNLLNSERERERIESIEVNDDWWEQKRVNLLKP